MTAFRNAPDPAWGDGPNPAWCDDLVWQQTTGMCGGCGEENCHDGPCTERAAVDPWYGTDRLLCDKCPQREAEGWWAA